MKTIKLIVKTFIPISFAILGFITILYYFTITANVKIFLNY